MQQFCGSGPAGETGCCFGGGGGKGWRSGQDFGFFPWLSKMIVILSNIIVVLSLSVAILRFTIAILS